MKTVNIYKYLAIVAFLVAGLSGCIMDKEIAVPENPKGDKMVTISMSVPGAATPRPSTRAMTPKEEKDITSVYVMLFRPSDHADAGQYYMMRQGTNLGGSGDNRTFEVKVPEGKYDFVVIANPGTAISEINITDGMQKSALLPLLQKEFTDKWSTSSTAPAIPMWGGVDSYTVTESTSTIQTVDMHRMLAKVEVQLSNLAASGDAGNASGTDNFSLGSVYVYNYNTKGCIVPDLGTANWHAGDGTTLDPARAIAPTLPANPGKKTGTTNKLGYTPDDDNSATGTGSEKYGTYFSAKQVTNMVYLFEAANTAGMNASERPCVVIGGYFDGSTTQTYYRVDFVDNANSHAPLNIVRNHKYIFLINRVSGEGHPDPDAAFSASSSNMEANILDWNEVSLPNITFDGTNYLALSHGEYTFDREGICEQGNILRVKTDVSGGWTAALSSSATAVVPIGNEEGKGQPWINITPGNGGASIAGGSPVTISVSQNETGAPRSAYIHLVAGRLNVVVPVTQTTEAAVGIRIVELDASDNVIGTISGIEFAEAEGSGVSPAARKVKVIWSPADADLVVSAMGIGGAQFEYANGSEEFENTTLTGGQHTWTIQPGTLAYSEDKFYEQNLMALFTVQSEGKTSTQTLTVRHFKYNGDIETEGAYLMDGGQKTFTVKSNAPWKAYYVRQAPGAGTASKFITRIGNASDLKWSTGENESTNHHTLIAQGGYNLPEGNRISFNLIDELGNGAPTLYTGNGHIVIVADEDPITTEPYYSNKAAELFCCSALIRGAANCYMVDNRSDLHQIPIMIPLTQLGNAETQFPEIGTLVNDLNNCTAEILWSDRAADWSGTTHLKAADAVVKDVLFVKGSDYASSYVMVFPGSSEGNTSVALRESGTIKWSWHIWNVGYYPYDDYFAVNSQGNPTATWLDRNLGALRNTSDDGVNAYGLYYQFGRKDPFSGYSRPYYPSAMDTDNATNKKAGQVTLAVGIKNPQVFYTYNGYWTNCATHDLWNQRGNAKSVFDPSPEGYRIPTTFPMSATPPQTFNAGHTWSEYGGWYPASGYRLPSTGALSGGGSYGHYWAATPTSYNTSSGDILYFYYGYLEAGSSTFAAESHPVRCVAE